MGDLGSIPGSGRFPREGIDNPLQYSCLENSMDQTSEEPGRLVHGVSKCPTGPSVQTQAAMDKGHLNQRTTVLCNEFIVGGIQFI